MVREGLTFEEATRRIWALGIQGLLTEDSPQLIDFQVPYARPSNEVAAWSSRLGRAGYTLADVVELDRHAAVQPDLQGRGGACGPDPLDRWAGAGCDREPVPTGRVRRSDLPHRAGKQRVGIPRSRPWA
jgi:hypothetical protein